MAVIEHLYLHVPFCARVCPYCSFHVHRGGVAERQEFATALATELRHAREQYDLRPRTIYFGGGTPSLLTPAMLEEIVAAFPAGAPEEFTIEANPKTVTAELAQAWRRAGINRVSLGAQSFDRDFLRILGRQHVPEDIPATVALLRDAGFANINIDLMFALPSQPEALWQATLEAAIACRPDHLSAYALTYEEDTPFLARLQRGEYRQDEEREAAMFRTTVEVLTAAGLPPYEISNFARPGFESRHNRAYWQGREYLGCGPSACSTISSTRWRNVADTPAYIAAMKEGKMDSIRTDREDLAPRTLRQERIMLELRTKEGVDARLVEDQPAVVAKLVAQGLAAEGNGRLRLSEQGRLVADSVAAMLMS